MIYFVLIIITSIVLAGVMVLIAVNQVNERLDKLFNIVQELINIIQEESKKKTKEECLKCTEDILGI